MDNIWKNNKECFVKGESVLVKAKSETSFIGEIVGIDNNIISISKDGKFYFNYHIKQIFKNKN